MITDIHCDDGYESDISAALELFVKYLSRNAEYLGDSSTIIATDVYCNTPSGVPEIFKPIPPDITTRNYQISNYGHVLDEEGNLVPYIYYDDGPRIPILSDNGCIEAYYSLALLMAKTFDQSLSSTNNIQKILFDKEFENIKNIFENAGFKSINNYCEFTNSCAYVYPNDIGSVILNQAKKIEECF